LLKHLEKIAAEIRVIAKELELPNPNPECMISVSLIIFNNSDIQWLISYVCFSPWDQAMDI